MTQMDNIKKNIYSSRVLAVIGRQSEGREPAAALRREVIRATGLKGDELDEILQDLLDRGFIETGRAINDTYIKIKQQ